MRTLALGLIALAIIVALLGYFFWSDLPHGAHDIGASVDYGRFLLVTIATFVGVISNTLYDRLTAGHTSSDLFRGSDIIFAAIVSPVVLLPIYRSLGEAADPVIVALTAYQNGFFFNVIFDKIRKSASSSQAK